jgi:hypothetical protein
MGSDAYNASVVDHITLKDYLTITAENSAAMMRAPSRALTVLVDIDQLMNAIWTGASQSSPIPLFLGANGQMLFHGAIRTAIGGHVAAIYPLLRGALESACYGFRISQDPALLQVWADREKGEVQRKACRKAFNSAVGDAVKDLSRVEEELAQYIKNLYEESITYGAHPNVSAVLPHVSTPTDEGDHWRVNFGRIYVAHDDEIEHALLACAEYGLVVAYINVRSMPSHPQSNVLTERFQQLHLRRKALATDLYQGDRSAHK